MEVVILEGKHALDIQVPKESSDNFKPTGAMRVKAQVPEKHAIAGETLFLKQDRCPKKGWVRAVAMAGTCPSELA